MVFLIDLQNVLEIVVCHAEHHVAIHLNEAAITVIGKTGVSTDLREPGNGLVVETEIEHRVHHARHRSATTRPNRQQ